MKLLGFNVALMALVLLLGCSSAQERANSQGSDQILRWMQQGKLAFNRGDVAEAMNNYSQAATAIDVIWAQNANADKASSLWYGEQAKDFRGEPYERMMLFFYLGILYYNSGDYGNAQAAFKQVSLQGAETADAKNHLPFKLAILLEAFSLKALGSDGGYQNALIEYKQAYRTLPFDEKVVPTALVIVESGQAPRKKWDKQNAKLYYTSGEPPSASVTLSLGGQVLPLETVSMIQLAQAKGLREADKYAQTKQTTKKYTGVGGNVATRAGADMLGSDDKHQQALGAALLIGGIASMLVSGNIVDQGDTRYWQNLPGSLAYSFFTPKTNNNQLVVKVNGNALEGTPILVQAPPASTPLKIIYYRVN